MLKGNINHKQITKSTDHFELKGMISPNFVNDGQTTVRVFFKDIPPGGQFAFEFPLIFMNTIPVIFNSVTGKKDLVRVYFATIEKQCN